jgi:uncharacterized protein (DUF1800 family)
MPIALSSLSPQAAWQPLPAADWDEAAARHLLQRLGFSAPAAELTRALHDGPATTVQRCFAAMPAFPKPELIEGLEKDRPELARKMTAGDDEEQRRLAQRDARERSREALLDMTIRWLQLASRPENSAAEKWLLFLSDVWVVSIEKVKNAALVFQHQEILRRFALATAPDLARAMSRSPAMIVYLDLQQSKREAPNENFARELFELFTLGEGNYTEDDIKQAARAFTGYRQKAGEFLYARRQHDDGAKTVFGHTGNYSGDDIIGLVFQKKAAGTFLPKELVRFYLSDTPLPAAYTDVLGANWAQSGFELRRLAQLFFGSRAFFAGDFRGNFIKSPVQFYLGLLQDLDLSVPPVPRRVIGALRQMGQLPFDPPNVRGWIGGRAWINSATLATRRQLIDALLHPINEAALNADEVRELTAARQAGITNFTLADAQLKAWRQLPPAESAAQLLARSLPGATDPALRARIEQFIADGQAKPGPTLRTALAALLESPDYQLC